MPEDLRRVVTRYGSPPLERRWLRATAETVTSMRSLAGSNMGAAGLVWDRRRRVLLVRHRAGSPWGDRWVSPGGAALPGEDPEETLRREVREETGLEVHIIDLTKVFEVTLADGGQVVTGFFFQFEAVALTDKPRPGAGILEVRWFRRLPRNMAFREDYMEAFRKRKAIP